MMAQAVKLQSLLTFRVLSALGVVVALTLQNWHYLIVSGGIRDPGVLFLCVHNAGRSQMAAGWLRHLAGDLVKIYSAGSAPATEINPMAVTVMAEVGIDISGVEPQSWSEAMVEDVDVVVTMGCGDICPVYPGKRYLDWELEDPAGQGVEMVRIVRNQIGERVRDLIHELVVV